MDGMPTLTLPPMSGDVALARITRQDEPAFTGSNLAAAPVADISEAVGVHVRYSTRMRVRCQRLSGLRPVVPRSLGLPCGTVSLGMVPPAKPPDQ